MSSNPNQFRLATYLGTGAIFLALLALIFFGMPKLDWITSPDNDQAAKLNDPRASNFGSYSSGKKLTDRTATGNADEEEENPASIAGELVLRADSRKELERIFSMALKEGGEFKGIIPDLLAVRIKFPTKSAAKKFQDLLGEAATDNNYVVMAPDFPDGDNIPTDGAQPERNDPSSETLQPFGTRALEFLGVTGDNSSWGENLTIAILDSGVYAHDSLSGINIKQIDLVQSASPEGDTGGELDYTGHGTGVASITHSVSPSADLLSVRVLDSDGVGDTFTVAQGIMAAADNGANIINLSLGSYGDSIVLRDAIDYANGRGVAVVAASGNDGIEQVSYPAAYENVIGVSAIDAAGNFADFSNTGDGVDISAPGVGVHTAWDQDGSANFSGTSAAAPFVSAAIAATMTRNPGYTVGQAAEQVKQSAQDTGAAGRDPQTGNGILNLGE
ncbi:MAG: hypothetical protein ACI8XO_004317 [Verrucomicrobiales bacterium]|jgi:hypothetical protein